MPGYAGLHLPNAVTMPQQQWAGICELAADRDFCTAGQFSPQDCDAIHIELRHWLRANRRTDTPDDPDDRTRGEGGS